MYSREATPCWGNGFYRFSMESEVLLKEKFMGILDDLTQGIKTDREAIRYLTDAEFDIELKKRYSDQYAKLILGMRREIAKMPRTEIYKVPANMSIPYTETVWDVLNYNKFCRPWVLQFYPTCDSECEIVVLHVKLPNDAHVILQLGELDQKNYSFRVSIIEDRDIMSMDDQTDDVTFIMALFHAMQTRQYIDVLGGHGKKKNPLKHKPSSNVIYTLHLNEKGKRYIAQQKSPTANTHWKNGKEQMEIPVETFTRLYHVGKGRTQEIMKIVNSFSRKQWVLPEDRITKVSA